MSISAKGLKIIYMVAIGFSNENVQEFFQAVSVQYWRDKFDFTGIKT